MKELGLGVLGWSPRDFWAATFDELNAALRGLQEFHGQGEETKPATYDDLTDLIKAYPDK